jgi:hypothetical protein
VLLVSTYELGHQPIGVAGPAGTLRARGHDVRAVDLAVQPWDPTLGAWAERIAISVPMHTAARIARELAPRLDRPLACYGLYAAMCADVAVALGGRDPGRDLVRWVEDDADAVLPPSTPARDLLPPLDSYASLAIGGESRGAGAVEASAGCVHRCRHCPVPVVFDGRIRIVDVDAVLADVEQQVAAGARHITFVDPDFFSGPHHARRVARAFHAAFPDLTFDCTVKVQHVLRHRDAWPELAAAGCVFVVSAFESVNDAILARLDKHHTAADAAEAVTVLRDAGIEVRPSWLPFTPWSTRDDVEDIVEFVAVHDLVPNVDPIQYTIRLLLPRGALLLDQLPPLAWDATRLSYRWTSSLDPLQERLAALVADGGGYADVRAALGLDPAAATSSRPDGRPRLTEPWFCCAEPTDRQLEATRPGRG